MSLSQYNYTISTAFPNGKVAPDRLTNEIDASSITVALDHIDTLADVCSIYFKAALSGAEQTTLNGLVAVHSGQPLPDNPLVIPLSTNSIIKTTEFTISAKAETTITALNYTVTTGKKFYLSYFGGSSFGPLPIIVRIKVAGTSKFMLSLSMTDIKSFPLPAAIQIATGGDAITVTTETQVARGQGWAGFAGVEI